MERIEQAESFYRKKLGKTPADDGYLYSAIVENNVVFSQSEEAIEAYVKGNNYSKKTIKFLGWFVCAISNMFWLIVISLLLKWKIGLLFLLCGFLLLIVGFIYDKRCRTGYRQQKAIYRNKVVIINNQNTITKM